MSLNNSKTKKRCAGDRYGEMYKQQELIEKKKQEIQAKLEEKKRIETEEALKKLGHNVNAKSQLHTRKNMHSRFMSYKNIRSQEEPPKPTLPNNIFSNDGSFLQQFHKISGIKPPKIKRISEGNSEDFNKSDTNEHLDDENQLDKDHNDENNMVGSIQNDAKNEEIENEDKRVCSQSNVQYQQVTQVSVSMITMPSLVLSTSQTIIPIPSVIIHTSSTNSSQSVHPHSIPPPGPLNPHSIPSPGPLHPHSIPPPGPLHPHSIPPPGPLLPHSIPPPSPLQPHSIPPPNPLQPYTIPPPRPIQPHSIPPPPTPAPPTSILPNMNIPPPPPHTILTVRPPMDINSASTGPPLHLLPPPPPCSIANLSVPPPMSVAPPPIACMTNISTNQNTMSIPPPSMSIANTSVPPPSTLPNMAIAPPLSFMSLAPPPVPPPNLTSGNMTLAPSLSLSNSHLPPSLSMCGPPPVPPTQMQMSVSHVPNMSMAPSISSNVLSLSEPPPPLSIPLSVPPPICSVSQSMSVPPPISLPPNSISQMKSNSMPRVSSNIMSQMPPNLMNQNHIRQSNQESEISYPKNPSHQSGTSHQGGSSHHGGTYNMDMDMRGSQQQQHCRHRDFSNQFSFPPPVNQPNCLDDDNNDNDNEDQDRKENNQSIQQHGGNSVIKDIVENNSNLRFQEFNQIMSNVKQHTNDQNSNSDLIGGDSNDRSYNNSQNNRKPNNEQESIEERNERRAKKRRSRWGDDSDKTPITNQSGGGTGQLSGGVGIAIPLALGQPVPLPQKNINVVGMHGPAISQVGRSDPALVAYARQAFGTTNLSEEDWKKAEDHYKINLLYQDMLRKRQELEKLRKKGKFKYEYDSDEETEGGTWEHKLRMQEMEATQIWANELTEKSRGKHHIGDFLPPDELERFMEKYSALKAGREPDLSDYKEFKLREDNIGFQMLQKLGWQEGSGLGQDGSGIQQPVNKASSRIDNQGLGVDRPADVTGEEDEFEAYRKRMMLAYRFRPNPLNNPRRPYY